MNRKPNHSDGSMNTPSRKPGRRGAVLLVALVAIAVASVVFTSLLRLSVAERRRVQTEAWQVQAAWLAESGLERAAARLDADAAYQFLLE